jgi:hypothetical protein
LNGALDKQEQAIEIHRRGRRILAVMVVMPWVLVVVLMLISILQ